MTISAKKNDEAMTDTDTDSDRVRVAVISPIDSDTSYDMFEVRDITTERAFLAGPLFFEVDEEFTLELGAGDDKILVRARVVDIEASDVPGMTVAFSELDPAERKVLTELAKLAGTV
jgi:hypothetical protein